MKKQLAEIIREDLEFHRLSVIGEQAQKDAETALKETKRRANEVLREHGYFEGAILKSERGARYVMTLVDLRGLFGAYLRGAFWGYKIKKDGSLAATRSYIDIEKFEPTGEVMDMKGARNG